MRSIHIRRASSSSCPTICARVFFSILPIVISVVLSSSNAQLLPSDSTESDYYCGTDWTEANSYCQYPCPSGLDTECPSLLTNGVPRRCIAAAGCFMRHRTVETTIVVSLIFDKDRHYSANAVVDATALAGSNETAAQLTVDDDGAETIVVVNNEVQSNIPEDATLMIMDEEDMESFMVAFSEYLTQSIINRTSPTIDGSSSSESGSTISTIGWQINSSDTNEQSYDRPCVYAKQLGGYDPTATSLDIVTNIVGSYIPITSTITDEQFTDMIMTFLTTANNSNNNYNDDDDDDDDDGNRLIQTLSTISSFFDALISITAIPNEDIAESPSTMPSSSPTRDYKQIFNMDIDPTPTGSYGIVFDVRTPKDGNTILLTSMSFVTSTNSTLEYEIYTKLGKWQNTLGDTAGYELIASGLIVGQGSEAYTRVHDDDTIVTDVNGTDSYYIGFIPIHVPGDRGRRSFYITTTKKIISADGTPIPILFSNAITNDTSYDYQLIDKTAELEIYEGDGILDYPWPRGASEDVYYRRPRGFFGSFEYEREPCGVTNFTGWPCPYVFMDDTIRPTGQPIISILPIESNYCDDPINILCYEFGWPACCSIENTNNCPEIKPVCDIVTPPMLISSDSQDQSKDNIPEDDTASSASEGIASWKITYRSILYYGYTLFVLLMCR